MPTLDDAPIVPQIDQVANDDLIQIYDVSEQKPKTISLSDLAAALGL